MKLRYHYLGESLFFAGRTDQSHLHLFQRPSILHFSINSNVSGFISISCTISLSIFSFSYALAFVLLLLHSNYHYYYISNLEFISRAALNNTCGVEMFTPPDLEALQVGQRRLRCDRLILGSVGLETLHHIQRGFRGLGSDFIGDAQRRLCPQLVGRHLAC